MYKTFKMEMFWILNSLIHSLQEITNFLKKFGDVIRKTSSFYWITLKILKEKLHKKEWNFETIVEPVTQIHLPKIQHISFILTASSQQQSKSNLCLFVCLFGA